VSSYDYDLFVIGAGSGGVRAGRLAAELGAKVAIAEEYRVGGTCVIRGCVPKKLLAYGSRYASAFSDARGFGWSYDDLRFDWPTLIGNVHREVDRLNGVYTRTLEKAGVELHLTHATLEDKNTVKLANRDKPIRAKTILVATGGHPMIPSCRAPSTSSAPTNAFRSSACPRASSSSAQVISAWSSPRSLPDRRERHRAIAAIRCCVISSGFARRACRGDG
jgi:glutathione reductase (NADPH)